MEHIKITNKENRSEIYDVLNALDRYNPIWEQMKPRMRMSFLNELRQCIAMHSVTLSEQIGVITKRPAFEAMSQEVIPVLEMSRYLKMHMPLWLRVRHKRYLRPGFSFTSESQYFEPYGTVAVILPSNFPFSLGLMSAFYLAAAGNTVILKLSEAYPHINIWIKKLIDDSGLNNKVIGLVNGGPESVNTLIQSGYIKKIFFFGRSDTGLSIKEQCMNHYIPCVLEAGGGSAAVVNEDADMKKAAAGVAWGGLYTSGHSCIGTRFVFVKNTVKEAFIKKLMIELALFMGEYDTPMILQEDTLDAVRHAVARGGIYHPVYSEYESDETSDSNSEQKPGIIEVSIDDPLLKKELYDPLIVVCGINHMDEAIDIINNSEYLIGASVWMKQHSEAVDIIRQLHTGMNWINDTSFGMPNLPWGSHNAMGQGTIFSKSALHEAGNWKWIITNHSPNKRFWWHPYTQSKMKLMERISRFYQ